MLGGDATDLGPPSGGRSSTSQRDHRADLLRAKVRPPDQRPGIIARLALIERMLARRVEAVVAVVAPPGYGKTTLLAQWSARHALDSAWISMDAGDNDPWVLLAAAALSLGRIGRLDAGVTEQLLARRTSLPAALGALTSGLATAEPMVVVVDNVESVTSPESLDVISVLAVGLPAGSQFATASRAPLPLPTPRLRSQGAVIEIGTDDLAMDRAEAKELLANADVTLRPDEVDAVHARTEGWPAGLYLAGLASKGRRHVATGGFAFHGDDVLMAEYLRSEILGPLSASTVSFLTRTSILTQLSGPLCDAVIGSSGSQATLETLEASNLLLVPLDRRRGWYRYHQLLGDLLRAELERREPALARTLHRRAATWLEEHNLLEDAINHAQRCGDPDVVARLVTAALQPSYAAGRAERALGWLEWFRAEGLIDRYREVAVLGALIEALSGHPASAERWTAAAELEPPRAMDGAALEGPLAYLRCVLCRNGTTRMRADARLAQRVLRAEEAMRAAAMLFEGLSYVLDGLPEHADPLLARAYDVSLYVGAMPTAATAAAQRSLIAAGRDEWAEAGALAERAVDIVESGHLQDYPAAGHAFVAAAHAALHRNDRQTAADHLARASRVRHLLTYAVPASSIVQLEIARVDLALADPAGARTVLRELRDVLHQRPDLGVVPGQADQLQQQLNALHHGPAGASSLTAAELRLLPYLATHLSFREIGERLHVSRHTVKSQAISVYRKVGATSRSEAIHRVHEIGLLEG